MLYNFQIKFNASNENETFEPLDVLPTKLGFLLRRAFFLFLNGSRGWGGSYFLFSLRKQIIAERCVDITHYVNYCSLTSLLHYLHNRWDRPLFCQQIVRVSSPLTCWVSLRRWWARPPGPRRGCSRRRPRQKSCTISMIHHSFANNLSQTFRLRNCEAQARTQSNFSSQQ